MRRMTREAGMGVSEENERKQVGRSGEEQEQAGRSRGAGTNGEEWGGVEMGWLCISTAGSGIKCMFFMTSGFEMS